MSKKSPYPYPKRQSLKSIGEPLEVVVTEFSKLNLNIDDNYGYISNKSTHIQNYDEKKNVNPNYLILLGKYQGIENNNYSFENNDIDKNSVNNFYWYRFENKGSSNSIRRNIGNFLSFLSSKRTKSKSKGGKRKNKRKTQRRSR